MLRKFILLFLSSIFFSVAIAQKTKATTAKVNNPSYANQSLQAKVDEFITVQMQKQKIPGVSLAVISDGKIVYVKGYGYANVEHLVEVKPETIFQSGSVGKQFTAFAIMLLFEDEKIDLEDPLSKFFPDAPDSWYKVKVKHLLTHTGGWASYPSGFNFRADYTEDSLYQIIQKIPFEFSPGEKYQYSNIGYVTLGLIISKVTGQFYGDFLKKRVFIPLRMKTARIITEADIVPNRAAGYYLVNDELKNQSWVSPSINTTADGSIYLSAIDMAKWEAALNAGKLLKKENYQAMWAPVKTTDNKSHSYGFGWEVITLNGKQIIEHGGSWQGFRSMISRYPDKKTAVVIFANLRQANTKKLAHGIMEIYHSELGLAAIKAIEDMEPNVTALVKEFIEKTIQEKLTPEMFTTEMAQPVLNQSRWAANFFSSFGELKKIELVGREELENASRSYNYRLSFKNGLVGLQLNLTRDNKIEWLYLEEGLN